MREKKPIKLNIRRKSFQTAVFVLLGMVFSIIFASVWYALYVNIMPAVNSFMFGLMGGPDMFDAVASDVVPYTVVALWGIPALLLCATLNVLSWQFSKLWFRFIRKVYRLLMKKYDEKIATEDTKKVSDKRK